jgi:PAS domain S-box-containing protein
MVVHLSGGYIEAHFHFFVVIAIVALYQDWVPFLIALGFVVIHHGLGGMLMPSAVYNHPDAVADPWRWAAIHGLFVLVESVACLVNWRLDERERKQIEAELRTALEHERTRLASIVAGVPGVVWETSTGPANLGPQLGFVSEHAEAMLGYRTREWLSTSTFWLDVVHADDRERVAHETAALLASGTGGTIACRWLAQDGRVVWVESQIAVLRGKTGGPVGMRGVTLDVSARHRAEAAQQQYAARLERANRDLQDFAYVASHDLQEPLRKVQAFGDRLLSRYAEALGEDGRDYLARMRGAAARMQSMINDLLAFSRITTRGEAFAAVDLSDVAREVMSDLEARVEQVGGRVELGALPTLEAIPLQMRQLLQNLIGNGLKFRRPDVAPVVRVDATELPYGRVELTVTDNGVGFDEKYLDRIFAPFQRLHGRAAYEGTGIGLAICSKVVERHGGSITARSVPGQGATFIITLPNRQAKEGLAA